MLSNPAGQQLGQAYLLDRVGGFGTSSSSALVSSALIPLVMVSILGFAAWIIDIIATATQRGRTWGLAGIVVGVLAPIIATIVLYAGYLAAQNPLNYIR